jgi:hypothetical protein
MTTTINTVGTHMFGTRHLTVEEYNEHIDDLPYEYDDVLYKISTIGFCVLYIPIFPIETIIFADVVKNVSGEEILEPCIVDKRVPLYETGEYTLFSTYHVNWKHVKSSVSFYILPIIIFLWLINLYIL